MKSSRGLLALALTATAIYSIAQDRGTRLPLVPKGAGVTSPVSNAIDESAYTPIQNALQHIFIAQESRLVTLAQQDNTLPHDVQRSVIDGAILTCNLYIRAMLTPAQQVAHDRDVLQIQTYKLGGPWKRVLSQKSVIQELLVLSPGQEKKVTDLLEKYSVGWSEAANATGITQFQRQAMHERNAVRLAKGIRAELTRAQLAEFNLLVHGFNREIAAIAGPYRVAAL